MVTDTPEPAPDEPGAKQAVPLQELRYLEQFEDLILTLSGRFVRAGSGELDAEIIHALQAIGEFARVDRSYVFQFSADGKRFTNTHEWCAEGVEPMAGRMQDALAEKFAWALQPVLEGGVLYVEDVSKLPAEAANVKDELEIQGIRAMVNVPLVCKGRVLGFVGFDSLRAPKTWTNKHRNLLMVVGEIIAGAIEREHATVALSHQLAMEKLVADISTRFINVPIAELEYQIQDTIRRIGEFTCVDRSYVFTLTGDGRLMSNTHEWCAPGIEPQIGRLQRQPVDEFAFAMRLLKQGQVFHVSDVHALPDEAERERREFESEGIRTLVNVPIMVRQAMIGFLGFDAVQRRKPWSEDDIRLLKLVGEIIANALDRKAAEERLQDSLRDKEVLLREIHHRVKNNMQVVNSLLYLQENSVRDRVDAVALDAFQQSRARIKAMAAIHDRLYRSKGLSSVDFDDYLNALIPELLQSYRTADTVEVEISAGGVELGIDAAIPCALILNELFTNSLKHAFPKGRAGKITVSMRRIPDAGVELAVADDGIGFADGVGLDAPKTLGLRLVKDLAGQLDGRVGLDRGNGSRVWVRFTRLS